MIQHYIGDILQVKRGIIVHGVNCYGVMGAGLAAQVARKWPKVSGAYIAHCVSHKPTLPRVVALLGTIQWCKISEDLWVVNAFTQFEPGPHASYDAVAKCVGALTTHQASTYLPMCFPLIGCGIGGLKWPIVKAIIEEQVFLINPRLYTL